MASVAIVEDHALLASTLALALAQRGVAADVVPPHDRQTLLVELLDRRPGLVLLDLDLGAFGDSITLIRPLICAGVPVLVVTGCIDPLRIALALEQGAVGSESKSAPFEQILKRTSAILAGGGATPPPERRAALAHLAAARAARQRAFEPLVQLTMRERETLRLLSDGKAVRQIAGGWFVSEATVRTYVRGILDKLGEQSQLAAVAAARRSGWFAPDPLSITPS